MPPLFDSTQNSIPGGTSYEDAIVIHARQSLDGVRQEYEWVEAHYGRREVD